MLLTHVSSPGLYQKLSIIMPHCSGIHKKIRACHIGRIRESSSYKTVTRQVRQLQ
ncbi:hypothetical protein WG66_013609 [Moniliophthora roreri]|nr:hypothetical protein WG66_013609 [Moniliophthora roreri]